MESLDIGWSGSMASYFAVDIGFLGTESSCMECDFCRKPCHYILIVGIFPKIVLWKK